jgi:hypothetical protein
MMRREKELLFRSQLAILQGINMIMADDVGKEFMSKTLELRRGLIDMVNEIRKRGVTRDA